ncbi:serine hydrolase [Streptomyces sp. NPDC058701]|uniref:serine hydrolase n=1 Tax=Streptomyces sp. NPDC058701 TaxID=3346608 RepID=UPI00365C153E
MTSTVASAAPAVDPERNSTAITGWGTFNSTLPTDINKWATDNNARVIDIEPEAGGRFTAQLVQNSGVFQRALSGSTSWTYGETYASLMLKFIKEKKRPIDVERYVDSSGAVRYAAAMVENTGDTQRTFTVITNKTPTEITSAQSTFQGKVVDLDPVGSGRYDAVLLKNTGVDATGGKWFTSQSPTQLQNLVKSGWRFVSLEPDSPSTFAVVAEPDGINGGKEWWNLINVTDQQISDLQAQTGARVLQVRHYKNASNQPRATALFIDDQSAQIAQIRRDMANVAGGNPYGIYLKQVDGPVLVDLNGQRLHDPASAAKVLVHLTEAMRIREGKDEYSNMMKYYANPSALSDVEVCAYNDDGTPILTNPIEAPVFTTAKAMMWASDNRATDALLDRVGGLPAVNSTAAKLGMTKTKYEIRVGCSVKAPGQTSDENSFTLQDFGKLYEQAFHPTKSVLGPSDDTTRKAFVDSMVNGQPLFKQAIDEEAAAIGRPDLASAFYTTVEGRLKGGAYNKMYCDGTTQCDTWNITRSADGWVSLPVRTSTGAVTRRDFVQGYFFEGPMKCTGGTTPCDGHDPKFENLVKAGDKAMIDSLRPQIRAALETWK